ncbi:MAG TPA: hypothetical protein VI298_05105 [Geobacteraceae bacterium]
MGFAGMRSTTVAVAVALSLIVSGCAPKSIRTNPDLAGKSAGMRIVALVTPDVKVYEVSAGGVRELRDEWSEQGRGNVVKAVISRFAGAPVEVRPLAQDGEAAQDVKEVMALFEAVSQSIILHTYSDNNNPNVFPDKVKNFDYSVGSLETILKKSGADALLLVYGEDEIATGGKKALNALGIVTGLAVAAFTGVAIAPHMEGTAMRMALADRNGTILWYNIKGGTGYDLRNSDSSVNLVNETMEEFPGLGK